MTLGLAAIQRLLVVALGCAGLIWGCLTVPVSEATDEFRSIESQLLHRETFSPKALASRVASASAQVIDDCDSTAQIALLLMELQLAQTALRSGAVNEFDQRTKSLESRAKRALSCAPRQSFIWLLAFTLEVLHGQVNHHADDLLTLSYETSPNEAWIETRRNRVAVPVFLLLNEPLQQRVLDEFRVLVKDGFVEDAARSYSAASPEVQEKLQASLEPLNARQQKAFRDAYTSLQP